MWGFSEQVGSLLLLPWHENHRLGDCNTSLLAAGLRGGPHPQQAQGFLACILLMGLGARAAHAAFFVSAQLIKQTLQ